MLQEPKIAASLAKQRDVFIVGVGRRKLAGGSNERWQLYEVTAANFGTMRVRRRGCRRVFWRHPGGSGNIVDETHQAFHGARISVPAQLRNCKRLLDRWRAPDLCMRRCKQTLKQARRRQSHVQG